MEKDSVKISGLDIPVYSMNSVIVGSGAAGLNAADSLWTLGQKDIGIVTEGLKMGTSRNTGSDKQTYYKLTLSGDVSDSVVEMAKTLFNGGCMHGDIALVEAALSARTFYKLVEIGVPFPHNRHGEYIGYKTDHDPGQRATSAGPLTSRYMTEKLEERVIDKGIRVFDGYQVIGILTDISDEDSKRVNAVGLIAMNLNELDKANMGFTLFNCTNIIYATGGPAGIYLASVYPESQTGASGIAFEAGVKGVNLTESQYGLASVKFRWNLSGTYQQVMPRYVSTSNDGTDEREFLDEYFESPGKMLDAIFLKGYQWPFDPRKIQNAGSSIIDILVYNETCIKGRRVYLDFTRNPSCGSEDGELDFSLLGREAYTYLANSGALSGKPIDRLEKMNRPAIDLFLNNGIDLEKEYLEIAVCAQHNNGGLMGNIWWESNICHFFPVGEVNGTFGVYRPGGSALNSTQVGSFRAAQYISSNYRRQPPDTASFLKRSYSQIIKKLDTTRELVNNKTERSNVLEFRTVMQARMTKLGAHIRSLDGIEAGLGECLGDIKSYLDKTKISSNLELPYAFQNWDIMVTQYVYLNAVKEYILQGGKSRGSYLISDSGGTLPFKGLDEGFRFKLDEGSLNDKVCEIAFDADCIRCTAEWKPVRLIPAEDKWFENVWENYRNNKIIV